MSSSRYDVVVLGTGGMGSAALFHLAQRGVKVCGFDRFGIAHDRGSSHGDSRVIRRAYYEHPDYVPLLERAYELWSALGDGLMEKTGLVVAGESGSEVMRGQAACYARHDLPHEKWSAAETRSRYPQFSIPDSMEAFFDPDGGYLLVEKCVETHIRRAIEMDAEFFGDEPVESWEIDGEGIRVRTANREVFADKLVITSGSWAVETLEQLGVELKVARKVLFWYDAPDSYAADRFPCYFVGTDDGATSFYGIPSIDGWGLKVAQHTPSTKFVADPLAVNRNLESDDEPPVLEFLRDHFPALSEPLRRTKHAVCLYTQSPDEHSIIDTHPENANVVIAAGFSGHGFKFASVIGEILADLAQKGETRHPIEFLRLDRPSIHG